MIDSESQPPEETSDQDAEPLKSLSEDKLNEIIHKDAQEVLESELRCAICQDIYINPMILNCSHSFCKFCVHRWLSRKTVCPECRVVVSFKAENLALRNIVNKMVQKSSPQFQTGYTATLNQRLKDEEIQEKEIPLKERDHTRSTGRIIRDTRQFFRLAQNINDAVNRNGGNDNSSGTETETESDGWDVNLVEHWYPPDGRPDQFNFLFRRSENPTASFIRDDDSESEESTDEDSADDDGDAPGIQIDSSSSDTSDEADDNIETDTDEPDDEEDMADDDDSMDWALSNFWTSDNNNSLRERIERIEAGPLESESSDSSDLSFAENETDSDSSDVDDEVSDIVIDSDSDSDDSGDSTEVCRYSDESTVEYGTDDDSL